MGNLSHHYATFVVAIPMSKGNPDGGFRQRGFHPFCPLDEEDVRGVSSNVFKTKRGKVFLVFESVAIEVVKGALKTR